MRSAFRLFASWCSHFRFIARSSPPAAMLRVVIALIFTCVVAVVAAPSRRLFVDVGYQVRLPTFYTSPYRICANGTARPVSVSLMLVTRQRCWCRRVSCPSPFARSVPRTSPSSPTPIFRCFHAHDVSAFARRPTPALPRVRRSAFLPSFTQSRLILQPTDIFLRPVVATVALPTPPCRFSRRVTP